MANTQKETIRALGTSPNTLFTLRIHRGDGMALLAMNWKKGPPPDDFVGFAIEYKEPGGQKFFTLKNRLSFAGTEDQVNTNQLSTRLSPIQKFRWVHFPRNAEMTGPFVYRVTPVFMNERDELSYGEAQEAAVELARETFPGQLNVAFTRGFVSSQAFVDRFASDGKISNLLPTDADSGLDFRPTHPQVDEALSWMGFEARHAILELLDEAVADASAEVMVVAYDLSEPEVVRRLEQLGPRLQIIIDDDGPHGKPHSGESQAAARLIKSAGAGNVKRQHMGKLQHNKMIVVDGRKINRVVFGSTNFSWRGFYVQANNALIVQGAEPVRIARQAFGHYWQYDTPRDFGATNSAAWNPLGLTDIDARVTFSPHRPENAVLADIAADMAKTKSSLFYSLAFLAQTGGPVRTVIGQVMNNDAVFVYGIADRKVGGLELQKPDGNVAPVYPSALSGKLPPPFKAEPAGGGGIRMHHKFVVIDFDLPTARVYLGSFNFSDPADLANGENLLLIRDRRVAVTYMVEALRIFDHYHFRVKQEELKKKKRAFVLQKPPRQRGEKPWWSEDYSDPVKIRDRELFSKGS